MNVYPAHIQKMARSFLGNPEWIQKAMQTYPSALTYAADHLRDDPKYQKMMFTRHLEIQQEMLTKLTPFEQSGKELGFKVFLGSSLGKPLLIQDKSVALIAVQCYGENVFEHLSDELRVDQEVALQYWLGHPWPDPTVLHPEILASDAFVQNASELAPRLPALREDLQNDRTYVLRAIQFYAQNNSFYEYPASIEPSLFSDPEIALAILRQNPDLARVLNKSSLCAQREFALEALAITHNIYFYLSEELCDDREIATFALSKAPAGHWHPAFLRYAGDKLTADREFVKLCVQQHAMNFGYIADELLEDGTFITELQSINPKIIHWERHGRIGYHQDGLYLADSNEKLGPLFAAANSASINHVMYKYRSYENLVKHEPELIDKYPEIFAYFYKFLPHEQKHDTQKVLDALRYDSALFEQLPDRFRLDADFALRALNINYKIAEFVPKRHWSRSEFVRTVLQQLTTQHKYDFFLLWKLIPRSLKRDRAIALEITQKFGSSLYELPKKMTRDREIVLAALNSTDQRHFIVDAIDPTLFYDSEIMERCMVNPGSICNRLWFIDYAKTENLWDFKQSFTRLKTFIFSHLG